ncbi:hypothetical protein FJT64_013225 [Amphibalanus amphitrite]|uniref:PDZ domain-containing protein n=1 Tax=Amphibalanus amphitrite TaxID=1232801 RepID=A0A6A4V0Z8_AMPAM|nr:hypothetical protein FJT64_013225 [Amphibalanus amphitrite]
MTHDSNFPNERGMKVEAVHEGTLAFEAGILPGDRLLSAAGVRFSDLTEDESIQLLRHLDYSALLHALVTADQALIGRLLAGPPAGETHPSCQQDDGPDQLPSHDPAEERAAYSIVVDPPEPPGSDEEAVDNQPGSAGSDEYLASCAAPSDFSVLSPELQQDILHSIAQLDSSCELFRAYFTVLERVADEAAGNSIREELLEFLQIPAKSKKP